ncbi:MAG: adenosylcobinamide-GDP ribazoletransferase [Candidatus Omnitrophota bacterium]|nr:adenosylcobinamide-GDP ribazoletransferase [Candidatus Omnitrophota bacterium]
MKRLLIALQFLTALPIKIRSEIQPQEFGRSLLYFPAVGLFIGIILACVSSALVFLPILLKGALILVTSIIITAAMHLDGFADTCDGFYAAKSREEALRIMRDSRIGVMGAVGIFCILLLKFTLIVSLPENILGRSLIMMAVFSRWSQSLACGMCGYARPAGKAKFFLEYARSSDVIIGGIASFLLFLFFCGIGAVILFIASFISVFLFITFARARIGGMTGDTIGATNEIAELAVLFLIAAKCAF